MSPARCAPSLLVLLAGLLAVGAAACGGGGEGDTPPTAAPEATPSPAGGTAPSGSPIAGTSLDLAAEPALLTILGADPQDFGLGIPSLGQGDFNDDGLQDVIIGAPLADGPNNSRPEAGEAFIIFGRADPPTTLELAAGEQDLTIYGGAEGDGLGFSVLGADVNGDGIDDILVGAPGTSGVADPRTDQGAVYLFYGSPDLGGVLDVAAGPQALTVTGSEGFSRVGNSIAAGDVNGDGTDDIVIGAPFAGREPGTPPGGPRTAVGEVYVVFGEPDLGGEISIHLNPQDFTISGEERFAQFGAAVAAADINGDGIDDIIVGAQQADRPDGAATDAGALYAFFGAEEMAGRISIAEGDEDWRILGAGERDSLGFPLVTGDFNGDGLADVAAGARQASPPALPDGSPGAAYVFFGAGDIGGTVDLAEGGQNVAVHGSATGELLPSALAAGDLDGNGADDLVLGSGLAGGPGERTAAGRVYIVLGGPELASVTLAGGGQSLAVVGIEQNDFLGTAVAVADVRGRGRPDLIALAAGVDEEDRADAGAAYIVDVGSLGE